MWKPVKPSKVALNSEEFLSGCIPERVKTKREIKIQTVVTTHASQTVNLRSFIWNEFRVSFNFLKPGTNRTLRK